MTIRELIAKVEKEKQSATVFDTDELFSFINKIEAEAAEQLRVEFVPYNAASDMDAELLVPTPYDNLYESYLKAKIDAANEEYDSYTNNQAQHVQDFTDFIDWIVRTGKAQGNKRMPRRFKNTF